MFEDFASLKPEVIAIIAAFIVIGVAAIIFLSRKKEETPSGGQMTTRMLVHGALCIAIAFVLSYIRIVRLPQGGSITPASMLPIFLFAYIYGARRGLIVSVAYGLLQLLQDFYVSHPAQLILDYPVAFGLLALAGVFANRPKLLPAGVLLGGVLRLLVHYVSGIIFFAEYAPEGQSVFLYSLLYNGSYVVPDMVICLIIALIPPVAKMAENLREQYGPKLRHQA